MRVSSLRGGRHTVRVRAADPVGNVDPTPERWTWTVDRTPPQTVIVVGPRGTRRSRSAGLFFRASERGGTFRCSVDGRRYAVCKSPLRLRGLRRGTHTVRIRAVDAAGNADRTPAIRTWRIV
jgi:hypothetical protein